MIDSHAHLDSPRYDADRDALLKHFALPASGELVRSLQTLAAGPTTLELFDASKIEKL